MTAAYRRKCLDWQRLAGRTIAAIEFAENLEEPRVIDGLHDGGMYSRLTLTFAEGDPVVVVTFDGEQYWSGFAAVGLDTDGTE